MSLAARLLNVFAIPSLVFDEVKLTPHSPANWLVPAVLLVVASWLGAWLVFSQESFQKQLREANDKAIQKLVDAGRLKPDQAELNRQAMRITAQVTPYLAPLVGALVSPFGWGLVLWLVGARMFHVPFPFIKAVEVAGLANAVAVLGTVVQTALMAGLADWSAHSAGAKPFDPQNPSPAVMVVANVATCWVLALRAIGLARLSGAPFMRAAAWVFGIWAGYTCLFLGLGQAVQHTLTG